MSRGMWSRALLVLGIAVALLASSWGTGVSSAQEHEHPTTTTTAGPTTTTRPTTSTTAPPSTPGAQTRTIRYGPFTIPGATNPDGGHGHAHTGNLFQFGVQKPCNDCFITGMVADLEYADGRQANWSTDAQLHHMVLFNSSWGRSDATCGLSFLGLLGQRFFAAGDERTPVIAPRGYGYYMGAWDTVTMIYELANNSAQQQSVYIEMDYSYVQATWGTAPGMTPVEPVWMDVDQCGDSEYSAPAGPSSQTWTWTVNRPGKIIGAGGHLHDGGVNLTLRNDSTAQTFCNSVAGYGESPAYIDHHGNPHISSMSTCYGLNGAPIATVANGQRVTVRANYDLDAPADDVMGIAIMYIAP